MLNICTPVRADKESKQLNGKRKISISVYLSQDFTPKYRRIHLAMFNMGYQYTILVVYTLFQTQYVKQLVTKPSIFGIGRNDFGETSIKRFAKYMHCITYSFFFFFQPVLSSLFNAFLNESVMKTFIQNQKPYEVCNDKHFTLSYATLLSHDITYIAWYSAYF